MQRSLSLRPERPDLALLTGMGPSSAAVACLEDLSLSFRPELPEPWEEDGEGAPGERLLKGFPERAGPEYTLLGETCSTEGSMTEGELVGVVRGFSRWA
jgi:hypothetical protein